MSYAKDMKNAIVSDLNALKTAGTLQQVISDDYSKLNPLDRPITATPVAIVLPPLVKASEPEDTATNLRQYDWWIEVAVTEANLNGQSTMLEDLMDAVLDAFDQDLTLGGTADGAIMPAIVPAPGPVSVNNVTYAVFYVSFTARKLVPSAVK